MGPVHNFTILADYYQFYIQDDDVTFGDLSDAWTPEAVSRLLAVAPHTVGIGTVRNTKVVVTVEILEANCELESGSFDRTNMCSIQIDTGRLVIAGCTDYFPDAARIHCAPGLYQVLVGYKGLNAVSDDGLEGQDSYHIYLRPVIHSYRGAV
jgi:hypothetical protein